MLGQVIVPTLLGDRWQRSEMSYVELGLALGRELGLEVEHAQANMSGFRGAVLHDSSSIVVTSRGFVVIDYQDGPSTALNLKDEPDFKGALVGQYTDTVKEQFGDKQHLVEPGFFLAGYKLPVDRRDRCRRTWLGLVRRNLDGQAEARRLFFAGSITKYPHLTEKRRVAEILRDRYPSEVGVYDGLLPRNLWLEVAAHHVLNLVLPLASNFSWRDIELLGVGLPFVSIEYTNTLRDPLLPDEHYVAVRGVPVDHRGVATDHELAAEKIVERYREALEDREALIAMSQAAMAWYDRAAQPTAVAERAARWCKRTLEGGSA